MQKILQSGETITLIETVYDEWAAAHLRRPIGTIERSLAINEGGQTETSYPSADIPREVFIELLGLIDSTKGAGIVLAFLEKLRSATDPMRVFESFKKLFPHFTHWLQVAYQDHFETYRKMISPDEFPSTEAALAMLNFTRESHRFDIASIFGARDFQWRYGTLPPAFKAADHHLLTAELMEGLAEEVRKAQLDVSRPVLEIAAGRGKLANGLRAQGLNVIATDMNSAAGVERITAKAAVEKYAPEIVVASWLPPAMRAGKEALVDPNVRHLFVLECQEDYDLSVERLPSRDWIETLEPFSIPSNRIPDYAKRTVFKVTK